MLSKDYSITLNYTHNHPLNTIHNNPIPLIYIIPNKLDNPIILYILFAPNSPYSKCPVKRAEIK